MFKNRAAAGYSALFAVGVAISALLPFSAASYFCAVAIGLSLLAGGTGVYLRFVRGERKFSASAFAVAVFALGACRLAVSAQINLPYAAYERREDVFTIDVDRAAAYDDVAVIEGTVLKSEIGVPDGTRLRVTLYCEPEDDPVSAGDSVTVSGKYGKVKKLSHLADGVKLAAYGERVSSESGNGFFAVIRREVSRLCGETFSDPASAASARAVTVGDRGGISRLTSRAYSSAGISHILAISGLHISFFAMALYNALRSFGLNRRVCGIAGAAFAAFYAFLVGFTPGAARAAAMMCILMISRAFVRRADSVTSLFATLALLLFIEPYALFSSGLQMSFLCCLGIIMTVPYLERLKNKMFEGGSTMKWYSRAARRAAYAVISSFAVSLAATVFSFPAAFAAFDTVSYLSPVANLVAIPLYSIAMAVGIAALPLALIWTPAASVVAAPAGWCYGAVNAFAKFIDQSGFGRVSVRSGIYTAAFIAAVAGIAAVVLARRKRARVLAFAAAAFIAAFAVCFAADRGRFANTDLFEYSRGDSEYAYIASDGGNVYIDLGGKAVSTDAVFVSGAATLDGYYVASYDDSTLPRLKRMLYAVPTARIYLPEARDAYEFRLISSIKQLANDAKCDIIEVAGGVSVAMGGSEAFISLRAGSAEVRGKFGVTAFFNGLPCGECDVAVVTERSDTPGYEIRSREIFVPRGEAYPSSIPGRYAYGEGVRIKTDKGGSEYDEPRYP